MPPTDTTYRPHIYGSDAPTPQGHTMQTCSRCGQTRAEVLLPGIGKRMFYRLQPDGRAFEHELACSRLEKLIALARSPAAGETEAQSAAYGAMQLLVHQKLVFYPEPPILTNALARYHATTAEEQRRAAALDVVRASQGSILVLEQERQALRQQAPPQSPVGPRRPTRGQQAVRLGRAFFDALFQNVELPDGSTVGQRRDQIAEDVRSIEEDIDALREQIGLGRRTNPATVKPKKTSSKKKRAPAKTTRAAKKSGQRPARKGKGTRR